jgi:hypothetical protein
MAKKPKYSSEGKDFIGGKFQDADLEFNLPGKPANPGTVRGAGTPFSKAAFDVLKGKYDSRKGVNDTESVTFGREAILTILAQYDCAGIKFNFVERMGTTTQQLTLVMEGVDENNKPLGNDLIEANQTNTTLTAAQSTLLMELGTGHPPTI